MELLAEISDLDFGLKLGNTDRYWLRRTVRCIILNSEDQVLFTYFKNNDDYILPGGGMKDETLTECAKREVMEETGYKIKILTDLGVIIEYRRKHKLVQISHCFLCHAIGSPQQSKLTQKEKKSGMEARWIKDITTAIQFIKNSKFSNYDAKFRNKRDSLFLQKAKDILTKLSIEQKSYDPNAHALMLMEKGFKMGKMTFKHRSELHDR